LDADYYPVGQRLALLGYGNLIARGGTGNYPGNGDWVDLYNEYAYYDTGPYGPSGNVTNQANIDTRGGSVAAGATTTPANGGNGGDVDLETEYYYGMFDPTLEHTVNTGAINTSGGDSLKSTTSSSGDAGSVWFWGTNSVTNSGTIYANGGHDTGSDYATNGYGNDADYIDMYTELGPCVNFGALFSNGGWGTMYGGDADDIELYGVSITNTGNIQAIGGTANTAVVGSNGGYGGYVELFAPDGPSAITQTGAVDVSAGDGDTAGDDGSYVLGGLLISGNGD